MWLVKYIKFLKFSTHNISYSNITIAMLLSTFIKLTNNSKKMLKSKSPDTHSKNVPSIFINAMTHCQ